MRTGSDIADRNRRSSWASCLVVMLALTSCGLIDYATGYEVSVLALYAIPIVLGVRQFGIKGACLVAGLCAGVWIAADLGAGHHYLNGWVVYWNALHRFFFFLCVAFGFHHAQKSLGRDVKPVAALVASLPICTQCHSVGSRSGHWQRFESYLVEQGGVQPQSKVCPDCARARYARAGFADRAQ